MLTYKYLNGSVVENMCTIAAFEMLESKRKDQETALDQQPEFFQEQLLLSLSLGRLLGFPSRV